MCEERNPEVAKSRFLELLKKINIKNKITFSEFFHLNAVSMISDENSG